MPSGELALISGSRLLTQVQRKGAQYLKAQMSGN